VPTVTFQLLYCFFVIEQHDGDFHSAPGWAATSLCVAQSGIERQLILSPWTVVEITTEGSAVAFRRRSRPIQTPLDRRFLVPLS
jgi:hypothetical protein